MPISLGEHVGTFSEGYPWMCGGDPNPFCFKYDISTDEWIRAADPLDRTRRLAAGVMLSETEFWITGGDDTTSGAGTETTIIFHTDTEEVESYIDLPERMWRHNVLRINDTTIFFIGGDDTGKAWFFDVATESFAELFRGRIPYYLAFAGLVEKASGAQEIVVTGGYENPRLTEILNLDTLEWREGPAFPAFISNGASVPYGKTFLAVGGLIQGGGGNSNNIYSFDPDAEEWVEISRVMTLEREWFAPVVVPPGYADCN